MTFVQYHYLLLHYLHSIAWVSGHFSSLFLDLYSSLILFTCFIICFFLNIGLILFFFLCQICGCSWSFGTFCSMFSCAMFSLHCCMNISSALFLFLFISKKCWPSSSQVCRICLEASISSVLDHEVAYISICGH